MLCCIDSPFSDPESDYHQQVSTNETRSYPGQRRNVLEASGGGQSENDPLLQSSQNQNNTNEDLISVTVPAGVSPGQVIHVRRPDGSGSLIEARVPAGMVVGSTFYVRAPPKENGLSNIVVAMNPPQSSDHSSPVGDFPAFLNSPQGHEGHNRDSPTSKSRTSLSSPISQNDGRYDVDRYLPTRHERKDTAPSPKMNVEPQAPDGQKLILVKAPPQALPGSTMYVQIPDEPGRRLTAQVPPNAQEYFYVAYTPLESSTSLGTNGNYRQQQKRKGDTVAGGLATGLVATMAFYS
jgi:hypothetical protein